MLKSKIHTTDYARALKKVYTTAYIKYIMKSLKKYNNNDIELKLYVRKGQINDSLAKMVKESIQK